MSNLQDITTKLRTVVISSIFKIQEFLYWKTLAVLSYDISVAWSL